MFVLCLGVCFFSCNQDPIKLEGKIAMKRQGGLCQIYEQSPVPVKEFKLLNKSDRKYFGLVWANQTDTFFGTEFIDVGNLDSVRGNIGRFDINGNLIDTVFEANRGSIAALAYPSRTDEWILFTIQEVGGLKDNPIEGLNRMMSIAVMDMKSRKIVDTLHDVGYSSTFYLYENPWINDERGFVFVKLEESNDAAGIYFYARADQSVNLIVPNGRHAMASPKNNDIAFILEGNIFLRNLDNGEQREIYSPSFNEGIRDIHWSPDGKYIYLLYSNDYPFNLFTTGEKLIDVSTGEELLIESVGHGGQIYTWR